MSEPKTIGPSGVKALLHRPVDLLAMFFHEAQAEDCILIAQAITKICEAVNILDDLPGWIRVTDPTGIKCADENQTPQP